MKNLKLLRENIGLTQEEVALKIGLNRVSYNRYETGTRQPDHDTIKKLAEFFNVSTDYLLGLSDFKKNINLEMLPVGEMVNIPVIGQVKAGLNGIAYEEFLGYEQVPSEGLKKDADYFFLKVTGDSMEPLLYEGDYVLIEKCNVIDNGKIGVFVVDGEEGTIKRIMRQNGAVILQSENRDYPPRVFFGRDADEVVTVGVMKKSVRNY